MHQEKIIFLIALVGLVSAVWDGYCNEKTLNHRIDCLARICFTSIDAESYWRLRALYDKVSYDKHVWALFFFRDPWKLYSQEIQDIMRGKDEI